MLDLLTSHTIEPADRQASFRLRPASDAFAPSRQPLLPNPQRTFTARL